MMFAVLPFLGLLVVAYAIIAILGPGTFGYDGGMSEFLNSTMFSITGLPSVSPENPWTVTMGDVLVTIGLVLLALEVLKATNTNKLSLGNHGLSALVFVLSLVMFIMVPNFGTTTFFLITAMTLFDVLVGMLTTIITARRDIGVPGLAG